MSGSGNHVGHPVSLCFDAQRSNLCVLDGLEFPHGGPFAINIYSPNVNEDSPKFLRSVQGDHTNLYDSPEALAVRQDGSIWVANYSRKGEGGLAVYSPNSVDNAAADGDVALIRVIRGRSTHLKGPFGLAIGP